MPPLLAAVRREFWDRRSGILAAGALLGLLLSFGFALPFYRLVYAVTFLFTFCLGLTEVGYPGYATFAGTPPIAGVLLAIHFWSWNASVALTSVAASVVLVNTQPVVVALLSTFWLR